MEVTRGWIVVVVSKGAYIGKPGLAVVVQASAFNSSSASLTMCPVTPECIEEPLFRVTLPPGERTGLTAVSQVMVDKIISVPRGAIVREVGRCDQMHLDLIDEALRRWLDL